MKTKFACAAFAALMIVPMNSGAYTLSDRVEFRLRAHVSVICNVLDVQAFDMGNDVELRIVSNCNSSQFNINLTSNAPLELTQARTYAGLPASVTAFGQSVMVRPSLPGGQYVSIRLNNAPTDLSGLRVSLSAA